MAKIKENIPSGTQQPPYLSVTKLVRLLEVISTRNLPKVGVTELDNYGIIGTDRYIALSALKFLGIIDDQGIPTSRMKQLQLKGEARATALKEIVQASYKKLFDTVSEPYQLDGNELINDFQTGYGASPRIAKVAVPAFLFLCEEAGFKERTTKLRSPQREAKQSKNVSSVPKTRQPAMLSHDGSLVPPLVLKIQGIDLTIPNDNNIAQTFTSDEFRSMVKSITTYADKYISDKKEVTNGGVQDAATSAMEK